MSNEPQIDTLEESVRALVIQLRGADDDVIERVKSELIAMCDDAQRTSIRDVLGSLASPDASRFNSALFAYGRCDWRTGQGYYRFGETPLGVFRLLYLREACGMNALAKVWPLGPSTRFGSVLGRWGPAPVPRDDPEKCACVAVGFARRPWKPTCEG